MLSIEKTLKDFAQEYYISKNSTEKPRIETSLNNIKSNLKTEFGNDIQSIEIFGSYSRKTILPRKFDPKSDIDLLIVFDHERLNYNPSTYRKHLHQFAEEYYPKFISYKSKPSVVLELNHINYDLVPGIIVEEGLFWTSDEVYIPESDVDWMKTDITGFSERLNERNERFDYNLKRVIRLLKAWNAKVDYPIASYELEQIITDMDFSDETLQECFFHAIDDLDDSWDSSATERKVDALKGNAKNLMDALEDEDVKDTKKYLTRILPLDYDTLKI